MTENEFLLADRIAKIKSINEQYDLENNAYVSFSGGKDSTVLHYLIDEALPNNKIPRVYADTGIELKSIRNFVMEIQKNDSRIQIIKPTQNIKSTLETYGYPFKSKAHSQVLADYQMYGFEKYTWTRVYAGLELTTKGTKPFRICPQKLKYQFSKDFKLKISDMCCTKLKKEPLDKWQEENNRKISIVGVRREEGGRRFNALCVVTVAGKI